LRTLLISLLLGCLQLLAPAGLMAQDKIELWLEKTTIVPGEPIRATITITGAGKFHAKLADTLGKFEILRKGEPSFAGPEDNITSTQELLITGFDTGKWRLPGIGVDGMPGLTTHEPDIMVRMMPADSLSRYHDIKTLSLATTPEQWPYWLGLGLATLLFSWLCWKFLPRGQWRPSTANIPVHGLYKLEKQLEALRTRWNSGELEAPRLGDGLMEILRQLLTGQAMAQRSDTGEELIMHAAGKIPVSQWQPMAQTVRFCAAARFGKYQPPQAEGENAIDHIQALLAFFQQPAPQEEGNA
jgi:hypothetical protein